MTIGFKQGLYSSSSSYQSVIDMPNIYIERESYDKIIRLGKEPKKFVNDAVKEKLEREIE